MKKRILGVLMAAAACVMLLGTIQIEQLQHNVADKVLRFHVLANSDSVQDQELKLQVRDAVGSMMAEKLQNVDSLKQSKKVVSENLSEIEQTAISVIQKQGYDYPVKAVLANCTFPEKSYGDYTFPAGTYQALKVVIGSGAGQNWWCVMYPNLCFSGSVYEVDEKSGEALQKTLTSEEYSAVMEEGNYKIKFKILGFMNNLLE